MKKFQTTIGIALMMAMTAGIAGCNVTPAQTSLPTALTTEETTTEETTTEETTTEETTKKATPTPIPESDAKTTVKDQYKRGFKVNGKMLYTHIPQVIIEDVDTKAFNAEVLKKFHDIAKKNDSRVYYSYFVGKKAVSLYITIELESGNSEQKNFYVYNCSRTTGKKLSREEMLKIMGVSSSTFNSKVKNAIKNMWKKNYSKDTSAEKKKMEKNSLSSKMINSAIPYVNKNGKKAYLVRQIEVPGQMSHIDLHGTFS